MPQPLLDSSDSLERSIRQFHGTLRKEVLEGNPFLGPEQQSLLREHHPLLKDPGRYPLDLVASIYLNRREAPAKAIRENPGSVVLDAGCGCGTDSILFAALGAAVVAVNLSSEELAVAEKRARYYEKVGGIKLNIRFIQADLNDYLPGQENFSLTWFASVLAVIRDQESLLKRVFQSTRDRGRIMLVDYNLLHPPFLLKEWRRRRRAMRASPEFSFEADFLSMVRRRRRKGARFFPLKSGRFFDDVQFFTPGTLGHLLKEARFRVLGVNFSGFIPPVWGKGFPRLENFFSRVPGLKNLGRAYLLTGEK